MIPGNIDHQQILADLNTWGLKDNKIELICGYSEGYVSLLKRGKIRQMTYQRAARLYNFWEEEAEARITRT